MTLAPEDYTALDTKLTFSDADAQCVWLYANLDVEDKGSETFTIEASGTSGDYSNVNIEVTVTIRDQGEVPVWHLWVQEVCNISTLVLLPGSLLPVSYM